MSLNVLTCFLPGLAAIPTQDECIGVFVNGNNIVTPRLWTNYFFNFDTVFQSAYTLLTVTQYDGWVNILWSTMDIVGPGMNSIPNNSLSNAVFIILWTFIANYYLFRIVEYSIVLFDSPQMSLFLYRCLVS